MVLGHRIAWMVGGVERRARRSLVVVVVVVGDDEVAEVVVRGLVGGARRLGDDRVGRRRAGGGDPTSEAPQVISRVLLERAQRLRFSSAGASMQEENQQDCSAVAAFAADTSGLDGVVGRSTPLRLSLGASASAAPASAAPSSAATDPSSAAASTAVPSTSTDVAPSEGSTNGATSREQPSVVKNPTPPNPPTAPSSPPPLPTGANS